MDYLPGIVYYIIATLVSYFLANRDYRRAQKTNKPKIKILTIIIITLLFGIYNYIITKTSTPTAGDRFIYIQNYTGHRETPSIGLDFVITIFRHFTKDYTIFFYASTMITTFLTLIAYRISKQATPKSLLFLLCTQYITYTISVLKQSYANAFATLALVFALNNSNLKDKILCGVCVFLSILFHHTGFILIPICLLLVKQQKKRNITVYIILLTLMIIFLEPLLRYLSATLSRIIPIVSIKIDNYLFENSSESNLQINNLLTIVKGIPFYVITLIGFAKRKELSNKIYSYDNLLLINCLLSITYVLTIFNAWIYRFSYLFLFASGILYSKIRDTIGRKNNLALFNILTILLVLYLTIRHIILTFINYGGY